METQEPIAAVKKKAPKKNVSGKAKGLGLKQLFQKKYKMLAEMPAEITRAFGELTEQILMFIHGPTGHGKSRLTMQLLKALMKYGDVMYVSPEEGHRRTMQKSAMDNLTLDEHSGRITFWDQNMTFDDLVIKLKKKKSAKYVVIDSIQYWSITFEQYKYLKETFPNKGFIFISHAKGKYPDGKLAARIEYDVDIKVRVEGCVAFVRARGNGLKHYIIWHGDNAQEGAWLYWGKKKLNQFKK